MRKIMSAGVIAIVFLATMAANVMLVQADDDGMYTPGYWKNHPASWPTSYSTDMMLGTVFTSTPLELSGTYLLDALNFEGHKGAQGAQQILARAAVAALLNAATFGSGVEGYPFSEQEVISLTHGAFNPGNRDKMISLAEEFDIYNNS